MPLKATIIFQGDQSVGQKDEVYTMELPYTEQEWSDLKPSEIFWISRKIKALYNSMHQTRNCKVLLPGEKE